jgi:septum formation protein
MCDRTYILASQSPRRRELLGKLHIPFEVEPAAGEERILGESPQEIVQNLARAKAQEVGEKHRGEQVLVIGADTVVVCDGRILGKPKDREDMERMIRNLQGRTHEVYTGVALLSVGAGNASDDPAATFTQEYDQLCSFAECTKVTFYPMSDEEIHDYALHSDGLDKAGGYGIQSDAARYIKGIEGDYNNVVGLPLARLYQELKKDR